MKEQILHWCKTNDKISFLMSSTKTTYCNILAVHSSWWFIKPSWLKLGLPGLSILIGNIDLCYIFIFDSFDWCVQLIINNQFLYSLLKHHVCLIYSVTLTLHNSSGIQNTTFCTSIWSLKLPCSKAKKLIRNYVCRINFTWWDVDVYVVRWI